MRHKFELTKHAARALEYAQILVERVGLDRINTGHILLGLIHEKDSLASQTLRKLGVTLNEAMQIVGSTDAPEDCVEIDDNPYYTPRGMRVLRGAYDEVVHRGYNYIGTEHILLSILQEGTGVAYETLLALDLDPDDIQDDLYYLMEQTESADGKADKRLILLKKYATNLNELAQKQQLDPVIGRDKEIQRVLQVLSRRTKNNPVLLGEPGVGKTAIAEGLAQRIVAGDVPNSLREKTIMSLSLANLVAGARYRGDFEERIKDIIEEIKKNEQIILFIDEIHTLVGAGAGEGSLDAANILKPALSRGEVQVIGATTLGEYKKYLEKDAALARRFQSVLIEEPTVPVAKEILRGLSPKYEAFHTAKIQPAAIDAAVDLSKRYLSDRFLPDKAIDVIDEAAASLRLAKSKKVNINELKARHDSLVAEKIRAVKDEQFEKAASLRDVLQQNEDAMEIAQGKLAQTTDKPIVVTPEAVAKVIAQWTGIPLTKIAAKESNRLLKLEQILTKRVVGQPEAVQAVARAIRRSRAGLQNPRRPISSFLFLGPTGVGKTELAKALAATIFASEDDIIRFDMSEYMEKHTVSRMIGSPPGYVGYEEGGQLTDLVRRKPYSLILFDEIEKAHPDVFNILLQVLEDGRLTDGKGRVVDFRNTILIMTSNAGAGALKKNNSLGFAIGGSEAEQQQDKAAKKQVLEAIKKIFKPEFLNRVDETIVFNLLRRPELVKIVDILLAELKARLVEKNIGLQVSPAAKLNIVEAGMDFKYGARPLKRAIQKQLENEIAEKLLAGDFKSGDTIVVRKVASGLEFVKKNQVAKSKLIESVRGE